nr:hypothetical protein Iba_chr05dCG12540 [Ipomoea batatas]GMD26267.1 hypothetical protein Iba_scaffold42833CG0010 [Ipomoea batatas]GME01476.1 hypothetical protein Iba_scaffold1677865CG0010 [Ipomoea batatas]
MHREKEKLKGNEKDSDVPSTGSVPGISGQEQPQIEEFREHPSRSAKLASSAPRRVYSFGREDQLSALLMKRTENFPPVRQELRR